MREESMAAAKRKKAARETPGAQAAVAAAGAVGLIASVIGNIAQGEKNENLQRNIATLQQIVADWQRGYQQLDAQLSLALATNSELIQQNAALRAERDQLRNRAYAAEQRALQAEAKAEIHERPRSKAS
jgi:LmbE family N-acetylglucosaminyl deacetylase